MIMPNNETTVNTNMNSNNFSIEMNSTMFSMLSKNVYNNVILAPIREWSTNAIDACIAANTEIEFDVHLPTPTEPNFSVRDYGTG
jgi:HSP90 family molecular chaperone